MAGFSSESAIQSTLISGHSPFKQITIPFQKSLYKTTSSTNFPSLGLDNLLVFHLSPVNILIKDPSHEGTLKLSTVSQSEISPVSPNIFLCQVLQERNEKSPRTNIGCNYSTFLELSLDKCVFSSLSLPTLKACLD
jgi:hypothetical protein